MARPGLRVLVRESGSPNQIEYGDAGSDDPMTRLLERPNDVWTQGQLLRATETYLALWGSAFWGIERDGSGNASELWPLRPDRVRIIPDRNRYVRGFVYEYGGDGPLSATGDSVVQAHQPGRRVPGHVFSISGGLALDMGEEALNFNPQFLPTLRHAVRFGDHDGKRRRPKTSV